MIRFWFKILFELPQFEQYEYIMRLDDDSQILGKWINVFNEMRNKRAVYFANDKDVDVEKSLPGLMKLQQIALKYIVLNNITVKQPEMIRDGFGDDYIMNYFNNFEVMKLEFFRRDNVRQWIEKVDQIHGILKYRWGDATLRYITLAMFAETNEVLHRTDYNLSYCHKC
jgi:mannosyltransferase